jgi:ABC-type uncharacterized transport system permease subunit
MNAPMLLGLAGLLTLLPAAIAPLGGRLHTAARADVTAADRPGARFWIPIAIATVGPVAFAVSRMSGDWHTGFGAALWTTIAATMVTFVAAALLARRAWRLHVLLMPYLLVLGVVGTLAGAAPEAPLGSAVPTAWLAIHIIVALATYALLTLAAVAGLSVWLKERAIRRRGPGAADALPPIADTERLLRMLLGLAGIVLGLGLATGMAAQIHATGHLLEVDHKTLLALATFVSIGALLIAHYRFGVRGRRAARFVLLAWLLMTLAYPGVKFVTDVLQS